jgi:AcrR family transcriptional regulator
VATPVTAGGDAIDTFRRSPDCAPPTRSASDVTLVNRSTHCQGVRNAFSCARGRLPWATVGAPRFSDSCVRKGAVSVVARPRGRPRLREITATRGAALAAATSLFAGRGLAATSMSAVAGRAGLPRAALYELYATKDQLWDAVVTSELEQFTAALVNTYTSTLGLGVRERVRARYRAVFEYAALRPEGFRLLTRVRAERPESITAEAERTRDRLTRALTDVLRIELDAAGLPNGQLADVLALLFLGIGEAVARGCAANPAWNVDAVIELAVEATLAVGGADRLVLLAADQPGRGG